MSIKFFRHTGNDCPATIGGNDPVTIYMANGHFWFTTASNADWRSGKEDSPLCWAAGRPDHTDIELSELVAAALVALTNAAEPAARPVRLAAVEETFGTPSAGDAPAVVAAPEVPADGWIEWHGGECPVPAHVAVDYIMRGEDVVEDGLDVASSIYWDHRGLPGDIVAYRLHMQKPQASAPQPVADADGWIEWDSGDTPPLPGDHLVDYRLNCGLEFEHREVADINWQSVSAYRPINGVCCDPPPAYDPDGVAFKRPTLDADATMQWYLSGPMSGLPENNVPAFTRAAKLLRGMGLQIVNPAEQTVVPDGSDWADYMRHDIKLLTDCKGVICLPGWQDSEGAKLEYHIAEALGMPVLAFEHLPHGA